MLQQEVFAKRLRGRDVVSVENLITVLPGYVYWGMQGKRGGEAEDTAKLSDVSEPMTSNVYNDIKCIAVLWVPQPFN